MPSPEQTKFVVRVSPEIHRQLVELAQENDRSLNNQVTVIFKSYFDEKALQDRLMELRANRKH